MTPKTAILIAAVLGLLGVLAGTFGAHGLTAPDDLLHAYETGVRFHLYHALAILALAPMLPRLGRLGAGAVWSFTAGAVIFAGSLYLLALTGQRWLGAITPLGGLGFLLGWALLIAAALRDRGAKGV